MASLESRWYSWEKESELMGDFPAHVRNYQMATLVLLVLTNLLYGHWTNISTCTKLMFSCSSKIGKGIGWSKQCPLKLNCPCQAWHWSPLHPRTYAGRIWYVIHRYISIFIQLCFYLAKLYYLLVVYWLIDVISYGFIYIYICIYTYIYIHIYTYITWFVFKHFWVP